MRFFSTIFLWRNYDKKNAQNVHEHTASKRIELEGPGCSGLKALWIFFQNHPPNLFIQFVFTWTLWNTTILPSLVRVCGIAPGFRFIIRVAAVVRSQIRTWISVYNNSCGSNGQISNSTFSNWYGHFFFSSVVSI